MVTCHAASRQSLRRHMTGTLTLNEVRCWGPSAHSRDRARARARARTLRIESSESQCDLLKRPRTRALFVPLRHKRIRFESNRGECFESQKAGQVGLRSHTMRRTSSRSLAAVSLLALLTALAVPNRAEAEERANHATSVRMVRDAERDVVRIVVGFSEIPAFTARLDRNGLRLLVDVPNADIQGAPTALTDRQGVVGGVMAQAFQSDGKSTTRLLVTLLEQAKYSVTVDGTDLVIALAKDAANLPTSRKATHTIAAPQTTPRIKAVRFEHSDVEDRVLIDCSDMPEFRQTTIAPGKYALTLSGSELGKELSRTLDVSAFGGVLSSVSSFVAEKDPKSVVIQSEGDKTAVARVSRRGTTLIWSFAKPGSLPSSVTGVGLDGGIARRAHTVHVEDQVADIPLVRDGSEEPRALAKSDGDSE